ncbi:MAG: hypothetical protein EZS28_019729 [Streblomastix strix]|uniref:Right handed beta helix domain-containing protein n=1 Tax=Streblomastix strix TaxID=222440 RepID=A0A5J4VR27_9EUKA|nr:MAG: hypothetical protein EZS28_019729 [Streblomastix strix]
MRKRSIYPTRSLIEKDRIQSKNCGNSAVQGGALNIWLSNEGKCYIANSSFINCSAKYDGGAIYTQISSGAELTIDGLCSFTDCYTQQYGGGLYAKIDGLNSKLILEDGMKFERCRSQQGGGAYIYFNNNGSFDINKVQYIDCEGINGGGIYINSNTSKTLNLNGTLLERCKSSYQGGGLYVNIYYGGQLIIDSCQFYQCESGNGGGIYVQIYFPGQCSFIIKNTTIHECKALNSTNSSLSYTESGYGGGIFLTGSGYYNTSTGLINLKGMKIYNNSADKYGQSLYVAITQVIQWCKYGILGDRVKGNYSDGISNKNELEGIPMAT